MSRTKSSVLCALILFCSSLVVSAQFSKQSQAIPQANLIDLSQKRQSCCGKSGNFSILSVPEYETYKLTGTYYTLNDNLTATLMFNNKGPAPLLATPTFYSLAGTRLQLAPIIVPAASYLDVDMHQMLDGQPDAFREGSLKISYQGGNYQLGAQIKLTDPLRKLIWAEQLVYTNKFVSSRLENVWWLPSEDAKTRFVISNTSSAAVTASISVDGTSPVQTAPYQISLAPWETRVLDIMRDVVGNENGSLHIKGGISITHSGIPGAVLARLFIAKPSLGYSATANFIDPETTASQKWHGNGFRFRNVNGAKLGSVVAVRNAGSQLSRVKGRIIYTRPDGNLDHISFPEKQIAAGKTKVFDLGDLIDNANVPSAVRYGGIEIEYDTPKGSVVVSVQTVSQNGEHVFQVPMFDPQKMPASAGGFPWKADGDYTTLVYIKNETDTPKKYNAHLIFEGGQYSLGIKELKANETVEVDFRKLRDEQKPDSIGNVIPANIDKGQIAWSASGGEDKVLSGRSEQVSLSEGIASTYACYNCCQNSVYDAWIEPWTSDGLVGDVFPFVAFERIENCYHQILGPYQAGNVTWSSSNTTVAAIDSYGAAEALDPGESTIEGIWETWTWWNTGMGYCEPLWVPSSAQSPVNVAPRILNVTSDTETYKISNILGNQNYIHFVTAKGTGSVELTATISPDTQAIRNDISWDGATESLADPLVATLSRTNSSKNTVKIKYKNNTIKELRVWVVWSAIASSPISNQQVDLEVGNPPGPGFVYEGGYDFTHTIEPSSIVTDSNRPDFSGARVTAPTGTHPIKNLSLSLGATKKWDASRQIRFKILNPASIASADTAFSLSPSYPADLLTYPSSDVDGNDDTTTNDETNDPYSNDGVLTSQDKPRMGIAHRGGSNGDTFEVRFQFREFTRLEIEGTWFRISDYYLWRFHFKFRKSNGEWENDGSTRATNNSSF